MKAYQLKITLNNLKPPVWRRIIVPAGLSFNQLSLIFNISFGWCGYHLSAYEFHRLGIELEDSPEDEILALSRREILDASKYIIDGFLERCGSFTYTYDFGDDWRHKVQVEKLLDDYENDYPQIIKYKGNTPVEDCGGPCGYYELKEILADPSHPWYEEKKEWCGGKAEIEFDLEDVNQDLAQLRLSEKAGRPMSMEKLYEDFYHNKPLKRIMGMHIF